MNELTIQKAAATQVATHALDALFQPKRIAVIGATDRAGSVGRGVMRNLLGGGFSGEVIPVHPHAAAVADLKAYPHVGEIPGSVDLAVIVTPPDDDGPWLKDS